MSTKPSQDQPKETDATPPSGKTLSTRELFEGEKEIVLVHEGERYRLRITRRNKLILQK